MSLPFSEAKLTTQNPFIDLVLYNLKLLAFNSIIKDQAKADRYETTESLRNASLYIACIENHIELDMFKGIQYPRDLLLKAGLDERELWVYENFKDNYYIPDEYRPKLTELLRRWFIDTYMDDKELNPYYRNLVGYPAIDQWGIPVREFEHMFPSYLEYDKAATYMHELSNDTIKELSGLGILDAILSQYPDHKYLKYKTYGINIYEARKKLDFQILWYPEGSDVDFSVTEEFLMKYTQNRKFMLETVYSYAMELEEKNYHDMMIIYLIISVLVDILVDIQSHIIKKDILDRRCIEFIFSMYGVPYYRVIPIEYQKSLARNIHSLCKYKSSTTEMLNIIKLFDTKDKYGIKIFKYWLVKERITDSYNGFEWKSKRVLKGNYNQNVEEEHVVVDLTKTPERQIIPHDILMYNTNVNKNMGKKNILQSKEYKPSNYSLEARRAAASTIAAIKGIKFDLTLFGDPLNTTAGLGYAAINGASLYDIGGHLTLKNKETKQDFNASIKVKTASYVNLAFQEINGRDLTFVPNHLGYDLNGNLLVDYNGGHIKDINGHLYFDYVGIIPFPFDYYLQKGNVLFIRLEDRFLVEGVDYEIYDYNKVRFFNEILDGKKELIYDFYYDKSTKDTKFNVDKSYNFQTKVRTYEGANTISLGTLPFADFFLKENQLIVTVDSVFLAPNTYSVDLATNTLTIDSRIDTVGKKVNCIFIYSTYSQARFFKSTTITETKNQTKIYIDEPFKNYCLNGNTFFVMIGKKFISNKDYDINISEIDGGSYITLKNSKLDIGTAVDFNFIYSTNAINEDIELVNKVIKLKATTDYQNEFKVTYPFKNYVATKYKHYVKYLDKYLPEDWYSITNQSLVIVNDALALHKDDELELELVYINKDRTKPEFSNIKAAITHLIAGADNQDRFPLTFPVENYFTKGNKVCVDIDGAMLTEGIDYVVNYNKKNIRLLKKKLFLKKDQQVNITFFYNGVTENTLVMSEETHKIFNHADPKFNINFPFFPYIQTDQGFITISENSIHSSDDMGLTNQFHVTMNNKMVSNTDINENFLFIYNKHYLANPNPSLTVQTLENPINISKDGYMDIKVPFDYYFENRWPYVITDAYGNIVDESEYSIFNGSFYFTNPKDISKYGGKLYIRYIYNTKGGATVGYSYEEDYAATTNLKFCKIPIDQLYVTDRMKDSSNYKDYDVMVKGDGWWDGVDYKDNNHQLVKDAIYKEPWNYARTKYYGISQMIDVSAYSAQMSYFYSMLYDDIMLEEKLLVKVPSLSSSHQFKLAHLFIFMTSLTYMFNGIEDFIIDNPAKTMIVQGFNFRTSLADLKEYLRKKHREEKEFPIWNFITPKSQIKDLAEFMNIYKTNIEVRRTICQRMLDAQDWEEYKVWKDLYDSLMTWKLTMKYFTLSNGEVAKTYTEFLQDKDSVLYDTLKRVEKIISADEKIDTITGLIDDIIYILNEYMGDMRYIFDGYAGHSGTEIMKYIMLMIEFFKSYKIVFLTRNTTMEIVWGKDRDEDTMIRPNDMAYINEIDKRVEYYPIVEKVFDKEINHVDDRFDKVPWMREDLVITYNNDRKYITIDLPGSTYLWSEMITKDINGTVTGAGRQSFSMDILKSDMFTYVKNLLNKDLISGTVAPFAYEVSTIIDGDTVIEEHSGDDSFVGSLAFVAQDLEPIDIPGKLKLGTTYKEWSINLNIAVNNEYKDLSYYSERTLRNTLATETVLNDTIKSDLRSFDKAHNIEGMFKGCKKLANIPGPDIIRVDTSKATSALGLYAECNSVGTIDASWISTNNMTTMEEAFNDCSNAISIDISSWDTSKVKKMDYMFEGCTKLVNIEGVLDMVSCRSYKDMFKGCENLVGLKVANPPADFEAKTGIKPNQYTVVTKVPLAKDFRLSIMINNSYRDFSGYFATKDPNGTMNTIPEKILKELKGKKASNVSSMFETSSLTAIPNLEMDTSKVEDFSKMFSWSTGITTIDTSWIDTSSATNMNGMFAGTGIRTIDISRFDTSKVTDFGDMFNRCDALTTITGIIDMSSCINCENMFADSTKLRNVKIFNPPLDFAEKCGLSNDQYVIVKSK